MKIRNNTIKRFCKNAVNALMLGVLSITSPCVEVFGNEQIQGVWEYHSTASPWASRVLDTPNYLCQLQYTRLYNKNSAETNIPGTNLFVIDKRSGVSDYVPASQIWKMSGLNVSMIEYNPQRGYIVALYDDGVIDLLYDNGKVTTICNLADTLIPYDKTVNGITFSLPDDTIYVATNFGYVSIDINYKGEVSVDMKRMNAPFTSFARCGSYYVGVSNDVVYYALVSANPASIADFQEMKPLGNGTNWLISNRLKGVQQLMPLNNGVAFLASGANANKLVLAAAFVNDGQWIAGELSRQDFTYGNTPVRDKAYGLVSPMRDGYFINGKTNGVMLSASAATPELSGVTTNAQVTNAFKPYIASAVKIFAKKKAETLGGSFDGLTMYEYKNYDGLSTYGIGDAAPEFELNNIHPKAPLYSICERIEYSPEYGMLFMNHGNGWNFTSLDYDIPALPFSHHKGEWQWHNPQFLLPSYLSSYTSGWNICKEFYPVRLPSGMAIDPYNPSHVYVGSTLYGIARFDLANPDSPILRLTSPADWLQSMPGEITSFAPTQSRMPPHCRFTSPGFDSDGTLWAAYNNLDAGEKGELWYWTRADREASANANVDASAFRPWGKIVMPDVKANNFSGLNVLRHTSNKNILFYWTNIYDGDFVFYDHKGTPDDTSDDQMWVLSTILDNQGSVLGKERIYCSFEDPEDGRVWVGTFSGCFSFMPREIVNGGSADVPQPESDDTYSQSGRIFEGLQIQAINKDAMGRYWFGTANSGLYCLSNDTKTILGHWTTDTSEIPSDCIYGIGCNPEDGSVYVSTSGGIARFISLSSSSNVTGKVVVSPSTVLPDYRGWVTISGLSDNVELFVKNSHTGTNVINLGKAKSGRVQFHVSDLPKKATGNYVITDGENDFTEFHILR